MFNYQEIEELKKSSMEKADDCKNVADIDASTMYLLEVMVYQNEQILRELNSIGYKLYKMQQDKNV